MNQSSTSKSVSLSLTMALVVGFFTSAVLAGDVSYVATLSGVECDGCKKTIAKSIGKIKGVKTIRIVKTGEGKHKMTVTTDGSASISRAEATAAIKHAEHYQIQSWSKSS